MLVHWNPPDTPGHPAGLLHGGQMRAPAEVSGAHLEYIDNDDNKSPDFEDKSKDQFDK